MMMTRFRSFATTTTTTSCERRTRNACCRILQSVVHGLFWLRRSRFVVVVVVLVFLFLNSAAETTADNDNVPVPPPFPNNKRNGPASYMVCGSATDQLLFHAANIAALHLKLIPIRNEPKQQQRKRSHVDENEGNNNNNNNQDEMDDEDDTIIRIPNVFLYHLSGPTTTQQQQRPTETNSVPLQRVLDTTAWLDRLQRKFRIRAQLDVTLISTNQEQDDDDDEELNHDAISPQSYPFPYHDPAYYQTYIRDSVHDCASLKEELLPLVSQTPQSSALVLHILDAMSVGGIAEQWVQFILREMPDGHHRKGICLHHLHGPTFRQQCHQQHPKRQHQQYHNTNKCDWTLSSTTTAASNKQQLQQSEWNDDVVHILQDFNTSSSITAQQIKQLYMDRKHVRKTGSNTKKWIDETLRYRGIVTKEYVNVDESYVYYVGQTATVEESIPYIIPPALQTETKHDVFGHAQFWSSTRRIRPKYSVGPGHEPSQKSMNNNNNADSGGVGNMLGLLLGQGSGGEDSTTAVAVETGRDNAEFWTLVDYFICREMRTFIGHSGSDFAGLQIATRLPQAESHVYWYNSQSVPLAHHWNHAMPVPIVYTYSEKTTTTPVHVVHGGGNTAITTRFHFMASIASARHHMPNVAIVVLYHGYKDIDLLHWLRSDALITVIEHNPRWEQALGDMVVNGDVGHWQRIDIPLYIDVEYCLYVSSKTLFTRPLDFLAYNDDDNHEKDDNSVLKWSQAAIRMSTGVNPSGTEPLDAGVMLLNIPVMRQSYPFFLRYIQQDRNFVGQLHGHDGAYNSFYRARVDFLPGTFSAKPYWPHQQPEQPEPNPQPNQQQLRNNNNHVNKDDDSTVSSKLSYSSSRPWLSGSIVHLDGPSIVDYIGNIFGYSCSPQQRGATRTIGTMDDQTNNNEYFCVQGLETKSSGVCPALALFAKHVVPDIPTFCKASFPLYQKRDNSTSTTVGRNLSSSSSSWPLWQYPAAVQDIEILFCQGLLQNLLRSSHAVHQSKSRFRSSKNTTVTTTTTASDPCLKFHLVIQRTLDTLPIALQPILHEKRKEIAMRFGFWVAETTLLFPGATQVQAPPGALLLSCLTTTVVGGVILIYLLYRTIIMTMTSSSSTQKHPRSSPPRKGSSTKSSTSSHKRRMMVACLGISTFVWLLLSFVVLPMVWSGSLS